MFLLLSTTSCCQKTKVPPPEADASMSETGPDLLKNGGMEEASPINGLPAEWEMDWKDLEKNPEKKKKYDLVDHALDPDIKVEGRTSARFTMPKSGEHVAVLRQYFATTPGQLYRFSAKIKVAGFMERKSGMYLTVWSEAETKNGISLKIPTKASGFQEYAITFTGGKSSSYCYFLLWKNPAWESPCTIWIDDVHIRSVGKPLEPDEKCLTGNFSGEPERNLKIPGTYSLYNGDTTSFDAPAFILAPTGQVVVVDHMTQEWLYTNAVPFNKGILTDGRTDYINFEDPSRAADSFQMFWVNRRIGGTVVFDLKKNYAITRVKVRPFCDPPALTADLYLKGEEDRTFTRVSRQKREGTASFEGLNMRARWVAVTACAKGLNECEIWGRAETASSRLPIPYAWPAVVETGQEENVKQVKFTDVGIYPQPREVKVLKDAFLVSKDTPLVLLSKGQPSERSRTTLQTFQADLAEETGLRLTTRESATPASLPGAAIRLSVRGQSPEMEAQLTKQVGAVVTNEQGYVLLVDSKTGIWLAGADEAGLFYGTRALLDLLKKQDNGLSVQAVAIRDWPRATLRGIHYTPVTNAFNDRFIRHMARLRYNAIMLGPTGTDFVKQNGTNVASQLIAYCDRYFIQVIPEIDSVYWSPGMVQEKRADEPDPLGIRRTMCVSHEGNRKEYLRRLDQYTPLYNSPFVLIGFDEIYQYDNGARWNCCPLCTARKLPTPELMAEWIKKVCAHLRAMGKTPMCYANAWNYDAYRGLDKLIKDDIPLMSTYSSYASRRANIKELGCKGWVQYTAGVTPLQDNEIGGWIDNWSAHTPEGMAEQGQFARYVRIANGFWAMSLPPPPECEGQVGVAMARLRAAAYGVNLPTLRSKPADFVPLDLTKQANESLKDEKAGDGHGWMDDGPGRDLRKLPKGKQTLAGVPFVIGGKCVMIENRKRLGRMLSDEIKGIPVGRKLAGITFIHTQDHACDLSQSWFCMMTYLGHYKIHYEDGTYGLHQLRYGVNLHKWDTDGEHSFEATVAWKGQTAMGYPVTLYLDEWINPYPEKTITRIDFCATKRPRPTRLALLAATGILARDYNTGADTNNQPALLTERERTALPEGLKEIPLIGGTYEIEEMEVGGTGRPVYKKLRYTTPEGIMITASNTYSRNGEPHLTHALVDNNWHWEASDRTALTMTFPAPRVIKALEIVSCYEDRRVSGLRLQDIVIETSPDGIAFTPAAEIKQTTAELDGRIPVVLSGQPIKALRVIPVRRNNYRYHTVGIAYLALYE